MKPNDIPDGFRLIVDRERVTSECKLWDVLDQAWMNIPRLLVGRRFKSNDYTGVWIICPERKPKNG